MKYEMLTLSENLFTRYLSVIKNKIVTYSREIWNHHFNQVIKVKIISNGQIDTVYLLI